MQYIFVFYRGCDIDSATCVMQNETRHSIDFTIRIDLAN